MEEVKVQLTNSRRVQVDPLWYYVVEDINRDTGLDGCTITYWEECEGSKFVPRQTFSLSYPEEVLAIGKTMVEFAIRQMENRDV